MLMLVDTNVLLRLSEPAHAHHPIAATAIETIEALDHRLIVVPQVVYEFWAVATRPQNVNGFGAYCRKRKGILGTFAVNV
jgi:predicted nucleic acid-binding protein